MPNVSTRSRWIGVVIAGAFAILFGWLALDLHGRGDYGWEFWAVMSLMQLALAGWIFFSSRLPQSLPGPRPSVSVRPHSESPVVRPYGESLVEVVSDLDVHLARSLLEANGIETFTLDEHSPGLVPLPMQPPRLFVQKSRAAAALDALKEAQALAADREAKGEK